MSVPRSNPSSFIPSTPSRSKSTRSLFSSPSPTFFHSYVGGENQQPQTPRKGQLKNLTNNQQSQVPIPVRVVKGSISSIEYFGEVCYIGTMTGMQHVFDMPWLPVQRSTDHHCIDEACPNHTTGNTTTQEAYPCIRDFKQRASLDITSYHSTKPATSAQVQKVYRSFASQNLSAGNSNPHTPELHCPGMEQASSITRIVVVEPYLAVCCNKHVCFYDFNTLQYIDTVQPFAVGPSPKQFRTSSTANSITSTVLVRPEQFHASVMDGISTASMALTLTSPSSSIALSVSPLIPTASMHAAMTPTSPMSLQAHSITSNFTSQLLAHSLEIPSSGLLHAEDVYTPKQLSLNDYSIYRSSLSRSMTLLVVSGTSFFLYRVTPSSNSFTWLTDHVFEVSEAPDFVKLQTHDTALVSVKKAVYQLHVSGPSRGYMTTLTGLCDLYATQTAAIATSKLQDHAYCHEFAKTYGNPRTHLREHYNNQPESISNEHPALHNIYLDTFQQRNAPPPLFQPAAASKMLKKYMEEKDDFIIVPSPSFNPPDLPTQSPPTHTNEHPLFATIDSTTSVVVLGTEVYLIYSSVVLPSWNSDQTDTITVDRVTGDSITLASYLPLIVKVNGSIPYSPQRISVLTGLNPSGTLASGLHRYQSSHKQHTHNTHANINEMGQYQVCFSADKSSVFQLDVGQSAVKQPYVPSQLFPQKEIAKIKTTLYPSTTSNSMSHITFPVIQIPVYIPCIAQDGRGLVVESNLATFPYASISLVSPLHLNFADIFENPTTLGLLPIHQNQSYTHMVRTHIATANNGMVLMAKNTQVWVLQACNYISLHNDQKVNQTIKNMDKRDQQGTMISYFTETQHNPQHYLQTMFDNVCNYICFKYGLTVTLGCKNRDMRVIPNTLTYGVPAGCTGECSVEIQSNVQQEAHYYTKLTVSVFTSLHDFDASIENALIFTMFQYVQNACKGCVQPLIYLETYNLDRQFISASQRQRNKQISPHDQGCSILDIAEQHAPLLEELSSEDIYVYDAVLFPKFHCNTLTPFEIQLMRPVFDHLEEIHKVESPIEKLDAYTQSYDVLPECLERLYVQRQLLQQLFNDSMPKSRVMYILKRIQTMKLLVDKTKHAAGMTIIDSTSNSQADHDVSMHPILDMTTFPYEEELSRLSISDDNNNNSSNEENNENDNHNVTSNDNHNVTSSLIITQEDVLNTSMAPSITTSLMSTAMVINTECDGTQCSIDEYMLYLLYSNSNELLYNLLLLSLLDVQVKVPTCMCWLQKEASISTNKYKYIKLQETKNKNVPKLLLAADDILPVYCWILVNCNVEHALTNSKIASFAIDPNDPSGQKAYVAVTLEMAIRYIIETGSEETKDNNNTTLLDPTNASILNKSDILNTSAMLRICTDSTEIIIKADEEMNEEQYEYDSISQNTVNSSTNSSKSSLYTTEELHHQQHQHRVLVIDEATHYDNNNSFYDKMSNSSIESSHPPNYNLLESINVVEDYYG